VDVIITSGSFGNAAADNLNKAIQSSAGLTFPETTGAASGVGLTTSDGKTLKSGDGSSTAVVTGDANNNKHINITMIIGLVGMVVAVMTNML
jgi:hypothetical protein